MFCLSAALSAACALAAPALAQERQGEPVGAADGARPAGARLVSEYVNLFSSCDAGAHLDNFAVELQNDAQSVGYIIGYAPGGEGGKYGRRLLEVTKDYLVNTRGLAEPRLRVINGGRYKNPLEAATQLWLVPPGAEPPAPVAYADGVKTFEGKFAQYVGWDREYEGEVVSWSNSNEVALAAFADHLRRQPDAVAYLVGYNFSASNVGTWRRVLGRDVRALQAEGIAPGRVKALFGGVTGPAEDGETGGSGTAMVQLWVLPPGAPPPVKEAVGEERPKEAQKLGVLPGYVLGEGAEREALEGLADVLRVDESLRAFLVVRMPSDDEMPPAASPGVDMGGLGEKWRKGLKGKHGVAENRVVVLVVPPREDSSPYGELETWVVPPGASPPDPFAAEDEEGQEEQGEEDPEEF
jgi:hypothetical protein